MHPLYSSVTIISGSQSAPFSITPGVDRPIRLSPGVCSATTFALQAPASDSVQLDCRVHSVYTASVTRDACAVETCRANGQAFAYTSAKCSVLQCEYGYQLYPYDGSEPASVYVFSGELAARKVDKPRVTTPSPTSMASHIYGI